MPVRPQPDWISSSYEKDAVLAGDVSEPAEPLGRCRVDATLHLNGLDDDGRREVNAGGRVGKDLA